MIIPPATHRAYDADHHTTLPVSEVFGPVWQGEGPHAGRICSFVRLGLCNLSCEWCDTPFTWDRTRYDVDAECPPMTAEHISSLLPPEVRMVVLSGGEPLMHQGNNALVYLLNDRREWHVETNGTIEPRAWLIHRVAHFTVSPKIATSDVRKKRIKPKALSVFADLAQSGQASWKIVCRDNHDVDVAAQLLDEFAVPPRASWIMPEGVHPDDLLATARSIADRVLHHGLNLSLRQQTLMYGTERAR